MRWIDILNQSLKNAGFGTKIIFYTSLFKVKGCRLYRIKHHRFIFLYIGSLLYKGRVVPCMNRVPACAQNLWRKATVSKINISSINKVILPPSLRNRTRQLIIIFFLWLKGAREQLEFKHATIFTKLLKIQTKKKRIEPKIVKF